MELQRRKGPDARKYHAMMGEYPKAICSSELFDVLWECHHKNGHLKTAQSMQAMLCHEGYWGIPRKAVENFIRSCLLCQETKRLSKKVRAYISYRHVTPQ